MPEPPRNTQHELERLERHVPIRSGPGPAPKPGHAIQFARVNASSKVELCVQMPTGSPIIIATEP